MVEVRTCKRCNHQWALRKVTEPLICPKCHSPYWNIDTKAGSKMFVAPPIEQFLDEFSNRQRNASAGRAKLIEYYVDENGCHICTSHNITKQGYPQMTKNGVTRHVARHVYIELHGVLPKNICVRHTCDNTLCINPDHLISGTFKQNTQDMVERNRVTRQYGETNPAHKLSQSQVLEIVEDLKTMSCAEISRKINIPVRTVNDIKNGEKWGWLTGIQKKRGVTNDR